MIIKSQRMPTISAELRCYDWISGDVSRVPRLMVIGAIQVLRNADGGGGASDFLGKSVTKV